MRLSSSRSLSRAAGLLALGVSFAMLPALAPADGGSTRAAAPALQASGARLATGRADADTVDLTPAERGRTAAEAKRVIKARTARTAVRAVQLPARVVVPVYVHVIQGTHRNERTVTRAKVRAAMQVLRNGFAGRQSSMASPTRFSFTIKNITFSRNDAWYHAPLLGRVDQQAKTKLHRGFSRALNLYFNATEVQGGQLLGYARFPWQYNGNRKLDGVTINVDSLPGGRARGYNRGDTVVHEVGHWLGLFHTFEGWTTSRCDPVNDAVSDTPAQKRANYGTPNNANLCDPTELQTKRDPAYNFMNYTLDRTMRMFTPGQVARMDYEYATYRY